MSLIFEQIPKVMSDIEAIAKNRSARDYKFRGIDDVYNELHPLLAKHKVFTTTKVLEHAREERPTKSGGVMIYSIMKIEFGFYASDGSHVFCTMVGEGADVGDKSSNKSMAVAHKYALMQVFAIPTEDDKDPENKTPEFAPKQAPRPSNPAPQQPMATDSRSIGEYVATFGKFKGQTLESVGLEELKKYVTYIESSARKDGKAIVGQVADFIAAVKNYEQEDMSMGNFKH